MVLLYLYCLLTTSWCSLRLQLNHSCSICTIYWNGWFRHASPTISCEAMLSELPLSCFWWCCWNVPLFIHVDFLFINTSSGDLRQVGGFLRVLRFPPPINWTPRYIWNIALRGIKHHNPNPYIFIKFAKTLHSIY
jgi:hypothetical protein